MKIKAKIGDNVVDVTVPDDFTEDQIAEALKSHPDLQQPNSTRGNINPRASMATPSGGRGMFGDAVRERTLGFANSMGKGIPILGNLVNKYEDTTNAPYSQDLERDYPITATGARILGGVLSTAPIAGGVAGSMAEGSGLARNILAQAGTFGGIGAADKIAEKGKDADTVDVGTATILNALGGAAGPVIGKMVTPSVPRHVTHDELDSFLRSAARRAGAGPRRPGRITRDDPFGFAHDREAAPVFGHLGDILEDVERQVAAVPAHTPPSSEAVERGLGSVIGGGLGLAGDYFAGGMNPVLSSLVGGYMGNHAAPAISRAVRNSPKFDKWLNNTITHNNPVLTSLGQGVLPSIISSVPPPE